MFKEGDRVKYTSGRWVDTAYNPLWGGQYGKIVGTIDYISTREDGTHAFRVEWDNYQRNYYEAKEIELAIEEHVMYNHFDDNLFEV